MKRRIIAFILALLCVASLLWGCTEETQSIESDTTTIQNESFTEQSTTLQQQESTDLASLAKKAESYVSEGESYTLPEEVAAYLHIYSELPENFITKKEAQNLGWDSSKGNLWDVADGKSIGGDSFGNYEGLLPKDTKYHECDVNYTGGYRQAERIIYGNNGSIYYTNDHYETFTQIY